MPQVAVRNMHGEKTGELALSDEVFGAPRNHDLIHQALVTIAKAQQRNAGRTKLRSDIRGTTAKWYRQKGTGRARHGARTSGLFVGGVKSHGPTGERGRAVMPRKMRRKALHSALSAQLADGAVAVIEGLHLDQIKTKVVVRMLDDLGATGKVLMVLGPSEAADEVVYRSARNIANLLVRPAPHFSVREVLWADTILLTPAALAALDPGGDDDAES